MLVASRLNASKNNNLKKKDKENELCTIIRNCEALKKEELGFPFPLDVSGESVMKLIRMIN